MKRSLDRRKFIKKTGLISAGSILLSKIGFAKNIIDMTNNNSPILKTKPLRIPWETQDPFIFCSYHNDLYPGGNDDLGPNSSLEGRSLGEDFADKDGWNMYHGTKVPGFPAHPHSGFETVTHVTKGLVDHSDSLGAAGRFGDGDVQWLTAGKGVQHAEMFPLLKKDSNPFEIFQIWLNLPKKNKKADPNYKMLWREDIPLVRLTDSNKKTTEIKLIAGSINDQSALPPTENSWANDPANDVQIWTIKMEANASFIIPSAGNEMTRTLYFYQGATCTIGNTDVLNNHLFELDPTQLAEIHNGSEDGYFLLLQGRPINEPIEQYGPFVANSRADLQETMENFRRTEFGGWPWPTSGPVHGKSRGRFARFPDGTEVIK
jgi:redox-sensitive bicupin YhaK (pirin superfamily)